LKGAGAGACSVMLVVAVRRRRHHCDCQKKTSKILKKKVGVPHPGASRRRGVLLASFRVVVGTLWLLVGRPFFISCC
jgi:hypothetical protein